MLNLYAKTAETQMKTYEQQYIKEIDKLFTKQKCLPNEEQLTDVMLRLLEQRLENREERIQCVNQFKIHCFHSASRNK